MAFSNDVMHKKVKSKENLKIRILKVKPGALPAFGARSVQLFLRSLGGGAAGVLLCLRWILAGREFLLRVLVAVLGCLPAALLAKGNVRSISNPAKNGHTIQETRGKWQGRELRDKSHISLFALCQEQAVSLKCNSSYPLR